MGRCQVLRRGKRPQHIQCSGFARVQSGFREGDGQAGRSYRRLIRQAKDTAAILFAALPRSRIQKGYAARTADTEAAPEKIRKNQATSYAAEIGAKGRGGGPHSQACSGFEDYAKYEEDEDDELF